MRGAGAFGIRCGKLARSRESDWLSLVEILILAAVRGVHAVMRGPGPRLARASAGSKASLLIDYRI